MSDTHSNTDSITDSSKDTTPEEKGEVTQLLHRWQEGDDSAREKLVPLVYAKLRDIAQRNMRGERANHTLQATALVNEAYMQLIDANVAWNDRTHFLSVAARVMRHVLLDHAKAKNAQKRGGDATKITLMESRLFNTGSEPDLLDLDDALNKLNEFDERKAKVIELSFFGGLTYDEIAEVMEISAATVDRELRMGKMWLARELNPQAEEV